LWAPSSGSLFADIKATKIGDMVTITISETSQASKQSQTQTSRAQSMTGQFSWGGVAMGTGATPKGALSVGPYSGSAQKSFNGTGQTNQQDSMTAYMSATVVNVLANGNLVIRGSRWTKVNDEMQQIILEGIVRPTDINRDNTVLSQNVAEAKIFLVGKGPVTQHNKPGWLGQIIDFVSPF
jgi:flagellar L-ring protein precursor FlgH